MLLLVEDETLTASAMTRALVREGIDVSHAASAAEARAIAHERGVEITGVLADAGLPEGGTAGVNVGAELRREHADLPIAIMTGSPDRRIANLAADIDAVMYFKPLGVDALQAIAQRARAYREQRRPIEERVHERALALGLTPREASIVASAARGLTRRDYVTREGITVATYRTHAASIRSKTGTSVRVLATRLRDAASRPR